MISRGFSPFRLQAACLLCLSLSTGMAMAAPQVVASIKPLQLIAAAITDGVSTPALAVASGQDPHHLSLRPSERRALQQAALVLWVGPMLELPLVDVIEDLDAIVITAQQLPAIQIAAVADGNDPHLWLDSINARRIAAALATELQQLDAANAAQYSSNATRFAQTLDALDADIDYALQPLQTAPWAVSHHAFRYFAQQRGLQEPLALTDSSNTAPGVRSVVTMREQLAARHIDCLLTEPTENHQQLDALLSGSTINIVSADVLGSTLEPAADAYANLLRQLTAALQSCMGGSNE